jgi:hypothetical protein
LGRLPTDAPERQVLEQGLAALEGRKPAFEEELLPPTSGVIAVETSELTRFLRDPADATLRRHLGIRDHSGSEALLAEDEPVRLDDPAVYQQVRDTLADFVAGGKQEEAVAALKERLAAAGRQSLAPVGRFGDLQATALERTLGERVGDGVSLAEVRERGLLREIVFGAARGELAPSRHLPEVVLTGLRVGDRGVDVALSGRVEFFVPAKDGEAGIVVVTDSLCKTAKLANRKRVPSHHVFGPLVAWCALRAAKADLELGETLAVRVVFRASNGTSNVQTWRFALSVEAGEAWLRSLLEELLGGTACELLPYEILAADGELVEAVRLGGEPLAGLQVRIADAVLADAENLHPLRHPPEFLGALDSLAVPDDAWERILSRLGPVWQGGQGE